MWNNARFLNFMSSALFTAAILMLVCGAAWRAAHFETFAVGEIDLVGDITHVTREQVETIVFNELEGTFFTVNLGDAQSAFEKLPWVRRVDIRRRWPNQLEVAVEEHGELARWGNNALVNVNGELFEGASNSLLPVFEGPDASCAQITQNYLSFNEALEPIGRRVQTVRVSERRAWQIHLDDGTLIELGREEVIARLHAYVDVYSRSVARLEGGALYIDLRYANGFTVRVKNLEWGETRA
jgi:cell division protein FtsQ